MSQRELFMWRYQQPFQISLQVIAESLFNQIDYRLKPYVFLIGILKEDRDDRNLICLEPEDCGYSTSDFAEINRLVHKIEKFDDMGKLHFSPQTNQDEKLIKGVYVNAMERILRDLDLYEETEKFVSYPSEVEGFFVFTVLRVQKEIFNEYYSLTKDNWNNTSRVYRSFLESVIDFF